MTKGSMRNGMPLIPEGLLGELFEIKENGGGYDPENGGHWVPGEKKEIPFRGTVLPIGSSDLEHGMAGVYTKTTRKVYTNGYSMGAGAKIRDPATGTTYTVTQDLDYVGIHPMKRYLVDVKEGAGDR